MRILCTWYSVVGPPLLPPRNRCKGNWARYEFNTRINFYWMEWETYSVVFDWIWTCQLNTRKAALNSCLCQIVSHPLVYRRSRSNFTFCFSFFFFCLIECQGRKPIWPSPFYFHGTEMPFPSNGISRNPSFPFNVRSLPETSLDE